MTGRDLRGFVTSPKTGGISDLVVRMKNGIGSSKYKPVNYQQLRSETETKKLASANIQLKIKKTQHAAKITKEQMLIKQHSQVWWKEHKRLNEGRNNLESQLQTFLEESKMKYPFFSEMIVFERQLSEDRERYNACTVHPIWQLRGDLKHRICELQYHSLHQSQMQNDFDPENIMQQVEIVKEQQNALIEKLAEEQLSLEEDLKKSEAQTLIESCEEASYLFMEVPSVLQELECPYLELKSSLILDFQQLAEDYFSHLQELDSQSKEIDRNCKWSEKDHWIFKSIINQYPNDLPNRRALYLDMLSRHLPSKPRQELVCHEKICDMDHFNKDQRRAFTESYTRYRKDFVIKALMTIAEACSAYETEMILANDRKKQQEICTELKEKVLQWKAHQEEAARLESAIAARKKEHEEQSLRQQKEIERHQRAEEKEKIQKYKSEKQQAWEELQRKDLLRLEQLRKIMAEQAEKDRERVLYRQQMLEKRLLERKEIALLEEKEEEERQRRLEALRKQVAVMAEFDPVRMMSDTKASKARLGIGIEEEFFLQKPLFELHTYSEQQIISDPRVRVEMALREAGLHNTRYAKEILPQILPPRPPRRDMESTVFKK
ncbi:coiled-coil domain-containing protein 148 [Bombina bombina]|uniref:coiled-coil domain-containing protein 148 n=1 Tax=Bombina bombina TaxID=8345 RepID=UPI00235A6858|nr:coiled-coil domain-containing protein 148 [Bombina bombina]